MMCSNRNNQETREFTFVDVNMLGNVKSSVIKCQGPIKSKIKIAESAA